MSVSGASPNRGPIAVGTHDPAAAAEAPSSPAGTAEAPATPRSSGGLAARAARASGANGGAARAWTSPGLDPFDFLKAVARKDPRVTHAGVAAAEASPGVETLDVAPLLKRFDAAPPGRKPKISELSAEYDRAMTARYPGSIDAGRRRLDAEFTFALQAAVSSAVDKGGTPAAKAALPQVTKLLSTSVLDWKVTAEDKRKATALLDGLKPAEFLFVLDKLRKEPKKIQWIFREQPASGMADRKAADLARSIGAGPAGGGADGVAASLAYHISMNWANEYGKP